MLSLIHAFCAGANALAILDGIIEQSPTWIIVLNILFAILNAALAVARYKEGR